MPGRGLYRDCSLQRASGVDVFRGLHQHPNNHPGGRGADGDYFAVVVAGRFRRIPGYPYLSAVDPMMPTAHIRYVGVAVTNHDVPVALGMIHSRHGNDQITIAQVIPGRRVQRVIVRRHYGAVIWCRQIFHVIHSGGVGSGTKQQSRAMYGHQWKAPDIGLSGGR